MKKPETLKPKKIISLPVISLAFVGTFVPLIQIQAQTTVLDSTGLSTDTSDYGAFYESGGLLGTVTTEMASGFTTGSSASTLDSITLDLGTGNFGSNFTLSLYADDGSSAPGLYLETLTGNSSPDAGGLVTYTSSGTALAAGTTYWWVSSATPSPDEQAFSINQTYESTGTSPEGWTFASTYQDNASFGGQEGDSDSGWNNAGSTAQFSVVATIEPAPEPSSLTLLATGGLALGAWVRHRRPTR
jgi:hypothetical protein